MRQRYEPKGTSARGSGLVSGQRQRQSLLLETTYYSGVFEVEEEEEGVRYGMTSWSIAGCKGVRDGSWASWLMLVRDVHHQGTWSRALTIFCRSI